VLCLVAAVVLLLAGILQLRGPVYDRASPDFLVGERPLRDGLDVLLLPAGKPPPML